MRELYGASVRLPRGPVLAEVVPEGILREAMGQNAPRRIQMSRPGHHS